MWERVDNSGVICVGGVLDLFWSGGVMRSMMVCVWEGGTVSTVVDCGRS